MERLGLEDLHGAPPRGRHPQRRVGLADLPQKPCDHGLCPWGGQTGFFWVRVFLMALFKASRRLDLQAKISLVLFSVIVPTFVIVTVAENQFTQPILEEELRQGGVNAGKTLANEIMSERWLSLPDPGPTIERAIQEVSYAQPNLLRIDVIARDEPNAIAAPFTMERFATGALVAEHGAAAVAH